LKAATDNGEVVPTPRFRRTQKERRAATEQRIIDAAVALIAESGSFAVSLADVGAAAGYSRGIVTQAFGTRDEMMRQVAIHAQQTFVPPPTETRGLEHLLVVVDAYLAHLTSRSPAARAFLLMWGESAATASTLRPMFAERDASFQALIRSDIAEGVAEGSIRADVEADAAAAAIMGQLRGIGLGLMHGSAQSPSHLREQTVAFTRHGLQRPKPARARGRRA
jgi:AcrR family transcriptional regulator